MSKNGFYNDNMFRAYPFVRDVTKNYDAIDAAIVDAGFMLGQELRYDPENDWLELFEIARVDNAVIFRFGVHRLCADKICVQDVEFQQQIDRPEFSPASLVAARMPLAENVLTPDDASPENELIQQQMIDGFMITGNLTQLLTALEANSGTWTVAYRVEPARIQNLYNTRVNTIAVANVKRTTIPACKLAETCVPPFAEEEQEPEPPCINFVVDPEASQTADPVFIKPAPADKCDREGEYPLVCKDQIIFAKNYCCGTGKIVLVPGTNVTITQANELNSFTFSAGTEAGAATRDETLCEYNGEIPFTEEEAVAFSKTKDLESVAAVPPRWKDEEKEKYSKLRPAIYVIASKEDPTDVKLADIALSDYLSGGPACKGLITTINGVVGANVNIVAGANIQVGAQTDLEDDCRQVLVVKLTDTARGNCDDNT